MSAYFDAARFGRLWRAHWAESWRDYAGFAGLTAMVDLVFIAVSFGSASRSSFAIFQFEGQIVWYACGLLGSGAIFAGRHFKQLASPGPALVALMRPASVFEKWLLALLCVTVWLPLAYTAGYCLLNYPAVQIAKALYVPTACETCAQGDADFNFYVPLITRGMESSSLSLDATQPWGRWELFFLLALWSVQGIVCGGTVFFKRSPILRTVLFVFLLAIVLCSLGGMPQTGIFWHPSMGDVIPPDRFEWLLSLMQWTGLPLLLWAAVFYHLKEREVS